MGKNNMYDYGKSIISTDLKYEFKNNDLKNQRIEGRFFIELKIYCGRKLMHKAEDIFENVTLNTAIRNIFKEKIENKVTFHEGHNYFATFKVYKLKPVRRPIYKKTDTYINSNRRKYLLQERINIYL